MKNKVNRWNLVYALEARISAWYSPCLGGSVVSVSDSGPGGCEFDPWLRRLFFLVYFHLSPLQKHVRKVVGGFGKKSCVSIGVRKPGNTCASPTSMIWPYLLKWHKTPIQRTTTNKQPDTGATNHRNTYETPKYPYFFAVELRFLTKAW